MNYRYFLKLVCILFCINPFNSPLADTCELQCRMETVNPNDMYGQEVCEYVCYGEVTVTGVQQNNQYDWPQLDLTFFDFTIFYEELMEMESGWQIEQQVHKEFCQDQRAKLPVAEKRCISLASSDASWVVDTECNSVGWIYGFDYQIAGVHFSRDGLSSADCRASVLISRDAVISDCQADAAAYHYALERQCSDVPR